MDWQYHEDYDSWAALTPDHHTVTIMPLLGWVEAANAWDTERVPSKLRISYNHHEVEVLRNHGEVNETTEQFFERVKRIAEALATIPYIHDTER